MFIHFRKSPIGYTLHNGGIIICASFFNNSTIRFTLFLTCLSVFQFPQILILHMDVRHLLTEMKGLAKPMSACRRNWRRGRGWAEEEVEAWPYPKTVPLHPHRRAVGLRRQEKISRMGWGVRVQRSKHSPALLSPPWAKVQGERRRQNLEVERVGRIY